MSYRVIAKKRDICTTSVIKIAKEKAQAYGIPLHFIVNRNGRYALKSSLSLQVT